METSPELILDLHGSTTAECKEKLEEIISSKEFSHIRIIIGKGLNSENGPVLPYFVKNYLAANGIKFQDATQENGGEGAIEIFL